METVTISPLSGDEQKILKRITLISSRNNYDVEFGNIFYTRPLTTEYRFTKQETEGETQTERIVRLIKGYHRQEDYPSDEVDSIILNAIKNNFPRSVVKNDTILFNTDLSKIELLKRRRGVKVEIYFSHEIDSIYDFPVNAFKALKGQLNVYGCSDPKFIEGQIFYAYYNTSNTSIIDKLKLVRFK